MRVIFQAFHEAIPASNPLIEFTACIGHLETAGLIQRLSFGDLTLLQPKILDASALLHAVKDEPDGLGYMLIEHVYQGYIFTTEPYIISGVCT